jgi:hypothetical protein
VSKSRWGRCSFVFERIVLWTKAELILRKETLMEQMKMNLKGWRSSVFSVENVHSLLAGHCFSYIFESRGKHALIVKTISISSTRIFNYKVQLVGIGESENRTVVVSMSAATLTIITFLLICLIFKG